MTLPASHTPDHGSYSGHRLLSPTRLVAALVVGGVGIAVCISGATSQPAQFWPAYLVAAVFWIGVSLGGLSIGLLHRVTGGRWGWGFGMGRELQALMGALPVAVVGVAFLYFGLKFLYPWASDSTVSVALNPHQTRYLAPSAVGMRFIGCAAAWSLLALWCQAGYRKSVFDGEPHPIPRISAFGLIFMWLTMTFASIDALMSLTPKWSSSMFGALHCMGFGVSGIAAAIILRTIGFRGRPLNRDEVNITQDLGSLTMAFNLMWAYFAFSEYLIVWSGDIPAEVRWFLPRQAGWVKLLGQAVVVGHFALPFLLLLSRDLKRNPRQLAATAGLLLLAEIGHLVWTVFPAFPDLNGTSALMLIAGLGAIGGPWLLAAGWAWGQTPFVLAAAHEESAGHGHQTAGQGAHA
jgi:hypothetical protein